MLCPHHASKGRLYFRPAPKRRAQSDVSKKIKEKLPPHLDLQIVNPQGILLLGRSNQSNKQQKQNFEILKRQYKHIAGIMTYDDLVSRLRNIIVP